MDRKKLGIVYPRFFTRDKYPATIYKKPGNGAHLRLGVVQRLRLSFGGDASAAPEPRSLDGEVQQLGEDCFEAFVGIKFHPDHFQVF